MSSVKKVLRVTVLAVVLMVAIGFGLTGAAGLAVGISGSELSYVLLGLLGLAVCAGLVFLASAMLRNEILIPRQGKPEK